MLPLSMSCILDVPVFYATAFEVTGCSRKFEWLRPSFAAALFTFPTLHPEAQIQFGANVLKLTALVYYGNLTNMPMLKMQNGLCDLFLYEHQFMTKTKNSKQH